LIAAPTEAARLLLLSNSRAADGAYLLWARAEIDAFLGPEVATVHFVPYARAPGTATSFDDYAQLARTAFAAMGYGLVSLHETPDPLAAMRSARAIVVGGGNTFQLLKRLYAAALVELIAARVRDGTPYIGWSAGSVVACPTISTTNDMPIVEPPSLRALGLVPFQINAHYTDEHPHGHQGETRAERIAEFLSLQPTQTVIGLREGALLRVQGADVCLRGGGARVFRADCAALDWQPADGPLSTLAFAPPRDRCSQLRAQQ
jgi:dipeptidase E